MLILLEDQYVNPDHIIQVTAHPKGNVVCVLLTNGQEIRVEVRTAESKAVAVARVASSIKLKAAQK